MYGLPCVGIICSRMVRRRPGRVNISVRHLIYPLLHISPATPFIHDGNLGQLPVSAYICCGTAGSIELILYATASQVHAFLVEIDFTPVLTTKHRFGDTLVVLGKKNTSDIMNMSPKPRD